MNDLSRQLMSCVQIGKAVTSTLDMDHILTIILNRASELIRAQNWTLYLVDQDRKELTFEVVVGIDPDKLKDVHIRVGEGIAGTVAATGEPIIVRDTGKDPRFSNRVDESTGFSTKSLITLPLTMGGQVVGVLQIINPEDPTLLEPSAVPVLTILADFVAIAITNARNHKRIERLTVTDDVSGFFNSRFLHQKLAELLAKGQPMSLVFLDMDNFKRIVDGYGHPLGSKVLKEVAQVIGGQLGDGDYLVRYGGDEYVIILPGKDKAAALARVEAIRSALAEGVFLQDDGHSVRVTASFGIANYPEDAANLKELLHRADVSMYTSKGRGKNTVTVS